MYVSRANSHKYIADRIAFSGKNFWGGRPTTSGRLPYEYYESFRNATYAVYSYATPIAFWHDGEWTVPNIKYSVTTTKHQNTVLQAIERQSREN